MKYAIKIRCPVCGMVISQKQLNKQHKFEIMTCTGLGKGKGFKWERPKQTTGMEILKLKMIQVLRRIADRMEKELNVGYATYPTKIESKSKMLSESSIKNKEVRVWKKESKVKTKSQIISQSRMI